jgi:chromate transporter
MKLADLVLLILLFNVMTFGNGPVLIPLLQKSLVDRAHVLSIDQLLYAFTVARITPGQANVYVASIGYMLFGLSGAILTTVAILLPGYLMLPLVKGYQQLQSIRAVRSFTRGLTAASVGLIVAATVEIGARTLTHPVAWICFILTFVMVQILRLNSVLSLVLASGVGIALKLLLLA